MPLLSYFRQVGVNKVNVELKFKSRRWYHKWIVETLKNRSTRYSFCSYDKVTALSK